MYPSTSEKLDQNITKYVEKKMKQMVLQNDATFISFKPLDLCESMNWTSSAPLLSAIYQEVGRRWRVLGKRRFRGTGSKVLLLEIPSEMR